MVEFKNRSLSEEVSPYINNFVVEHNPLERTAYDCSSFRAPCVKGRNGRGDAVYYFRYISMHQLLGNNAYSLTVVEKPTGERSYNYFTDHEVDPNSSISEELYNFLLSRFPHRNL